MSLNRSKMIYSAILLIILYSNFVSSTDIDSSTEYSEKIAWGNIVEKKDKYPYFVSLQAPDPNNKGSYVHVCAGALIRRKIIVTAAHCLANTSIASSYRVLPNYRNRPFIINGDKIARIKKYAIHPSFNFGSSFLKHDIAVALLDKADNRNGKILLKLPNILPHVYAKFNIMGFGAIGFDRYPNDMMEAIVLLRSDTECIRELGKFAYEPGINICVANQYGTSGCPGDAGGPVVWTNPADGESYLIGLVSSVRMPCYHFMYTALVNVYRTLDFIEQAMRKLLRKELRSDQTEYFETSMD